MKFTINNLVIFEKEFFGIIPTNAYTGKLYGQAFTQVFGRNFPDTNLDQEPDNSYARELVWSWLTGDFANQKLGE
jgi:hypothetical protein